MKCKLLIVGFFVLIITACSTLESKANNSENQPIITLKEEQIYPLELEFKEIAYGAPGCRHVKPPCEGELCSWMPYIKLEGKTVLFAYQCGKTERITPSQEEWRIFRGKLEQINIWQWQKSYANSEVEDGGGWLFKVNYADKQLESSGRNDYPDTDGKPVGKSSRSPAFILLMDSLSELINKPLR